MQPGPTELMRRPSGPYSAAAFLVRPTTPCLAMTELPIRSRRTMGSTPQAPKTSCGNASCAAWQESGSGFFSWGGNQDSRLRDHRGPRPTAAARHEFPAVASATVSSAGLALLPHDEQTILLTRHVTPARAHTLAERGWGEYVDSAGNASLRSPGLLIEIAGKRDPGTARAPSAAPPRVPASLSPSRCSARASRTAESSSATWQPIPEHRSAPSAESSARCASERPRCSTRGIMCSGPLRSRTSGLSPIRRRNRAHGQRRDSPATSGRTRRTCCRRLFPQEHCSAPKWRPRASVRRSVRPRPWCAFPGSPPGVHPTGPAAQSARRPDPGTPSLLEDAA